MMKLKHFVLFMAVMMAVALTGCSAGRESNSMAPVDPTNSMTSDYDSRASANNDYGAGADSGAGLNDGSYPSSAVGGSSSDGHVSDDYYQNNVSGAPSNGDNVIDDIGDAAGDLARGAGNVIGNAANDIGRAMR